MNQELYKARLREINELVEKNKKKLKHIEDEYLRGCAAMLANNQIMYNQSVKMPDFLKAVSVPTSIHTVAAIPNIFGVQVGKVAEQDIMFYLSNAGDPVSIVSQPLQTIVLPNILMQNVEPDFDPEELAYQCIEVAVTMTDDLCRLAVEEITQKAAFQLSSELHSVEGLVDTIKNASETVKDAIGRPANFVVLPVGLARYIKNELATEYDFDSLPISIRRVGCLRNKWTVYLNGYESRRILVGYRGTHPVDAGYFFCPALQFCMPQKQNDKFLIARRGKNVFARTDYYACVELTADKRPLSMDDN